MKTKIKIIFILVVFLFLTLASCKIRQSTRYKITDTSGRNYYTNEYFLEDGILTFFEDGRGTYHISADGTKIVNRNY